jgi:hypothetical protein
MIDRDGCVVQQKLPTAHAEGYAMSGNGLAGRRTSPQQVSQAKDVAGYSGECPCVRRAANGDDIRRS